MQQNTGLLAGVLVLGVLAAVFGFMFFNSNNEVLRLEANLRSATVDTLAASPYENQSVIELRAARNDLIKKQGELEYEIVKRDGDVTRARNETGEAKEESKRRQADADRERGQYQAQLQANNELRKNLDEVRASLERNKDARIKELERLLGEERSKKEELDNELRVLSEKDANKDKYIRTASSNFQTQIAALQQQIARYASANAQSASNVGGQDKETDGEILECDLARRMVMVNIGRLNKARPGMQFDVRRKRGLDWDVIAKIELIRVDETYSEAVVLDKVVPIKRCPITGWTTTDMNMRYSPFTTMIDENGRISDRALPLETMGVEERPTMNPMYPVLKGDKIYDRFFNPNHRPRFVLVGDPALHSREQIEMAIRNYNGTLEDRITADIDYVIVGRTMERTSGMSNEAAQRSADQEKLLEQARIFGIPFMREVELFRYLGT